MIEHDARSTWNLNDRDEWETDTVPDDSIERTDDEKDSQ